MDVLRKASRWLRAGGVLAATTNDVDSLVARLRGASWRQMHPPTHLFYFSRATLDDALRRVGMRPVHHAYVGNHRGYRSIVDGVLGAGSRLGRVLTLGGRLDFGVPLNLLDIFLVVARKR